MKLNVEILKYQLDEILKLNQEIASRRSSRVHINLKLMREGLISKFMDHLDSIKFSALEEIEKNLIDEKKSVEDKNNLIFSVNQMFKDNAVNYG